MEWIKWHKDTLPPVGERVLIAYKSGLVGAIEFFYSKQAKALYISGMEWEKENPDSDLGKIGNAIRDISTSDPIIGWMMCPKAPKWEEASDGTEL